MCHRQLLSRIFLYLFLTATIWMLILRYALLLWYMLYLCSNDTVCNFFLPKFHVLGRLELTVWNDNFQVISIFTLRHKWQNYHDEHYWYSHMILLNTFFHWSPSVYHTLSKNKVNYVACFFVIVKYHHIYFKAFMVS